ncbi:MAG: hypothetical protein PUD34_01475 [bacterium]|nr:hypothetical protein [bacterium]
MYEYDFNKENIVSEYKEITIKCDNTYYLVNILFTDKNILLFYDVNKNNVLKSRNVQVVEKFVLVLKQELNNINYKLQENNTILFVNENEVIIYNFNIENAIKA